MNSKDRSFRLLWVGFQGGENQITVVGMCERLRQGFLNVIQITAANGSIQDATSEELEAEHYGVEQKRRVFDADNGGPLGCNAGVRLPVWHASREPDGLLPFRGWGCARSLRQARHGSGQLMLPNPRDEPRDRYCSAILSSAIAAEFVSTGTTWS